MSARERRDRGKWTDPSVPKSGWQLDGTHDRGDDLAPCEMCERAMVRYAHTISHPKHDPIEVGCVCAGYLTGEFESVELAERLLRSPLRWKVFQGQYGEYLRASRRGGYRAYVDQTRNGAFKVKVTWLGWRDGEKVADEVTEYFDSLDAAKRRAHEQILTHAGAPVAGQ